MNLADLFPDEDYRFKMRFERGSVSEFFRPSSAAETLLAERRHWLEAEPNTYAALLPGGVPLLRETVDLARREQTLGADACAAHCFGDEISPWEQCLALGRLWEADYLLLKPNEVGDFCLLAGCVCFPSSWSLAEKIGRPLEFVHKVVPGLNETLGGQIQNFLTRLKPGVTWERFNWGLSRSCEWNHHPGRELPRLDASVEPAEVWLRVEHQALVTLPLSGGMLFGIRIALHSLSELKADAVVVRGLERALRTMPEELARYKGLAGARQRLLSFLRS